MTVPAHALSPVRRARALSGATALAMSILFFAELQPYETPVIFADPVASYAFVVHTLLFLGYLTASLLEGMRVCWRWGDSLTAGRWEPLVAAQSASGPAGM